MQRLTKTQILDRAKEVFGSKIQWVNWLALPKAHRFLTYCESNIKFYGADFYAQRKDYILDLFVFYRGNVTEDDFLTERKFEDAVKVMGNFEKECGYNNADTLFFAHYMFDLEEVMQEFDDV